MLKIEMRVNLSRADIAMAKQFLHRAQIARGFQQVTEVYDVAHPRARRKLP